jgi:hypothetical protein
MLLTKSRTTTDAPSFVGSCWVLVLVVVTVSESVVFRRRCRRFWHHLPPPPTKIQSSPGVVKVNPGQRLGNRVSWPRTLGHLGVLRMSEKQPVPLLRLDFNWILLNRVPIFVG